MDASPYRASYNDPIVIEDGCNTPPPKRQKTGYEPTTELALLASGVGCNTSHGPAKVLFEHSQIAIPASQVQENSAGSPRALSPEDVTRRPALAPGAQATAPARQPQTPEAVSVHQPGTIKMKMTGTVGLPPGYSSPRPPASGQASSRKPPETDRQKAPAQAATKHTLGQYGNHIATPVTITSPNASFIVVSGPIAQTPNTPANALHPSAPRPASTIQVPSPPPSLTGRRRGRPRKDGSNTRAALPSPSDAQRRTATIEGRSYEYWQNKEGHIRHGEGALFPSGYVMDCPGQSTAAQWTCPVVGCKVVKQRLNAFGKHFRTAHGDCFLNDFQNGTFGIVGFHSGKEQPIVLSPEKKGNAPVADEAGITMLDDEGSVAGTVDSAKRPTPVQPNGERAEDGPARPVRRDKAPSEHDHFEKTPLGRRYEVSSLAEVPNYGVPIPDLYERWAPGVAQNHWVCPIRRCLKATVHVTFDDLWKHFRAEHGKMLLNDNLDGTLGEIAARQPPYLLAGTASGSIVVSRMAPEELAEELKACGENIYTNIFPCQLSTPLPQGCSFAPGLPGSRRLYSAANCDVVDGIKDKGHGRLNWSSICRFLTNFQHPTTAAWVSDMLQLPSKRNLAWNVPWLLRYGFVDDTAQNVAALTMQITGDVAEQPCVRCQQGDDGPFAQCIVISRKAPEEAKTELPACGNCTYDGRDSSCEVVEGRTRKSLQGATHEAQPQPSTNLLQSLVELPDKAHVAKCSPPEVPAPKISTSERTALDGPDAHNEEDKDIFVGHVNSSLSSLPPVSPVEPPSLSTRRSYEPPAPRTRGRPPKVLLEPQPELSSTDHLLMEDWEMAPGRIRSTAPQSDTETGPAQNIAFSKPYLTANHSVKVSADASFRVDIITSGNPLRWTAKEDVLRICSVGAGKIRVRIQEEEEFDLGPHGMFRLVPGRSCVVTNRLYGNALLHVCEFPE